MISQRGLDETNIEPFEPQSLNAIIGAFPDKYPFDKITRLHKLSKSFEHKLMSVKFLRRQNRRFAQGYPNFDGALDARIKPDFIDHIKPDFIDHPLSSLLSPVRTKQRSLLSAS